MKQLQLELVALPKLEGIRTRREELAAVRTREDLDLLLANPIWRGDLEYFGHEI